MALVRSAVPLDCQGCRLARTRTQVVPGEGSPSPSIVFVGEAPGPQEDRLGHPFVGRAGKKLRAALRDGGWRNDQLWITNAVKCFPHEQRASKQKIRPPRPDELAACRDHLRAEFAALRPRLIVALGRTAAQALSDGPVDRLDDRHGTVVRTRPDLGSLPLLLTFHPSGLHYRRGRDKEFADDLAKARRIAENGDA